MQSVDEILSKVGRGVALSSEEGVQLLLYIHTLKSQRNDLNKLVHHRNQEILRLQESAK